MNAVEKAFVMPHPPIIIPDIGKGSEKAASKTISGCRRIAGEIAALRPETIVVITPHGPVFRDAVCVNSGDVLRGDFGKFGYRYLKYEFENDIQFCQALVRNMENTGVFAVENNEMTQRKLGISGDVDHGVLVPMHFIREKLSEFKIVHITYGMLGMVKLYRCGIAIREAALETGRRICVLASSDMSHRLSREAPAGYDPAGAEYDKHVVECFKKNDFTGFLDTDPGLREKAGECGHRSINIMMGVFEGRSRETEVFSYEGPFGVGYMTAMVTDIGEGPSVLEQLKEIKGNSRKQKRKAESEYVKLARTAIERYVKYGKKLKAETESDIQKGVFVSIKKHGALRGCIGTIGPTTDCVESEIIENAIKAAAEDPRFPAVTEDELEDLTISVDLLSEPEKIDNTGQLDPTEYGVIVSKGIRRGLLLPNLDGVDSAEKQIEIACKKAGIDRDEEYEIERFRVERFT